MTTHFALPGIGRLYNLELDFWASSRTLRHGSMPEFEYGDSWLKFCDLTEHTNQG